jgi:hypothetical protein
MFNGSGGDLITAAGCLDQQLKAHYAHGTMNGVLRHLDRQGQPVAVYQGGVIAACVDDPSATEAEVERIARDEGFVLVRPRVPIPAIAEAVLV